MYNGIQLEEATLQSKVEKIVIIYEAYRVSRLQSLLSLSPDVYTSKCLPLVGLNASMAN